MVLSILNLLQQNCPYTRNYVILFQIVVFLSAIIDITAYIVHFIMSKVLVGIVILGASIGSSCLNLTSVVADSDCYLVCFPIELYFE